MFSPRTRDHLFTAAGAVLAVVLGAQVAQGEFFWPAVAAAGLLGIVLVYVQPRPIGALLLAFAMFGYIVGNRGFAQFSLAGRFPLLPGEFVLAVGGALLLAQSAWRRELPLRRDPLNVALLLWIGLGTIRLLLDVRAYGITAIRDYALVYYAAFFFLAQHVARDPDSAVFLRRTLLVACGALLVVHPLFSQFPQVFIETFSVGGIPLIFFKDDLAGNFMSVGALLFFMRYEQTRRVGWLALSLALAGWMLTTNSRSSIVGLAVAALWLATSGRWRFAGFLTLSAVFAALVLLFAAEWQNRSWRDTPLHRVYDRLASIADPLGQRAYQTEDAFKGDNNVFRIVWWRASIDEALETNKWFGLGFGHDLAARFVREYFPEGNDDFTARSPHNVLITVFARMGIAGFAAFVAVLTLSAVGTWRALHDRAAAYTAGPLWCGAWILFVCACFGVVLEGPMGAVVFWTLLGLANAETAALDTHADPMSTSEAVETPATHLRRQPAPDQLASAP